MLFSLIIVCLVGIGFTRLTLFAFELRDNYDDVNPEEPVDIAHKRVEIHNKMVNLPKPQHLIVKGDNQFEIEEGVQYRDNDYGAFLEVGMDVFLTLASNRTNNDIKSQKIEDALDSETEQQQAILSPEETKPETRHNKLKSTDDHESQDCANIITVDPTEVCTICFEKTKNAVILGCGHGGICYHCCIDVFLTSGHCPFCRNKIAQIVMVRHWDALENESGEMIVPIIGPV